MAAVLAAGALIVFTSHVLGDYASPEPADNAAPAIRDLLAGDLHRYLADQPLMGSWSIIVRLPFAALASLLGGGTTLTYQLGALPCVVAPGLVGVLVARRMRAAGRSPGLRALAIALCLVNPATFAALRGGHPEELLAAALCVAAVLVAAGDRPLAAGVLAGMAIATKQWALLALVPVVLAAPASRLRLSTAALVTTAVLVLPAPLASPQPFLRAARIVGGPHRVYAASAWWALGSSQRVVASDGVVTRAGTLRRLPLGLRRSQASMAIGVLALALLGGFVALRASRGRAVEVAEALALLALLMLARCALDPLPLAYYFAPLLLALAAWEGLRRDGLPVGALLSAGVVAGLVGPAPLGVGPTATNLLVLAALATVAWYVGSATFAAPSASAGPSWRRSRASRSAQPGPPAGG